MLNNTIKLYIQSGCSSSRKAKSWLEEQNIPHELIHVGMHGISKSHINQMLKHTENGFNDIIKRTKYTEEMEDMSFKQLVDYLAENPSLIRMPVLFQGEYKVLIGYNEDDICSFLPRSKKIKQYRAAM